MQEPHLRLARLDRRTCVVGMRMTAGVSRRGMPGLIEQLRRGDRLSRPERGTGLAVDRSRHRVNTGAPSIWNIRSAVCERLSDSRHTELGFRSDSEVTLWE